MLTRVDKSSGPNVVSRAGVLAGGELADLSGELDQIARDFRTRRIAPQAAESASDTLREVADFETGIGMEAAFADLADRLRDGDLLSGHARCFGYFNPTPAAPAVMADLLVAARNPQLAVSSHAPMSVAIERRVINYMAERAGLPDGAGGHFTSGGSEANATSLQIALSRAHDEFAASGVSAFDGPPVFYASAESHLAWIKIARSAGLGHEALRLVPVAADGRMDVQALARMIRADRDAGACPVMIAATAGTTGAGLIDPLADIADLARQAALHLHVDAAWAGALVLDEKRRSLLAGIDAADTVTIDAHKWLSVPMGAGMILARNASWQRRAFDVSTSYMPAGDGMDPYVTSTQWSRRFIGARLWMNLRAFGRSGYQAMFDQQFDLAARLRDGLSVRGWTIRNDSPLPVVVFDDPDGRDSQALADWLAADGAVWLGRVGFQGRSVLRACITSFLADETDIDCLLDRLDVARQAVQPSR